LEPADVRDEHLQADDSSEREPQPTFRNVSRWKAERVS
jgi:hypothetical protein